MSRCHLARDRLLFFKCTEARERKRQNVCIVRGGCKITICNCVQTEAQQMFSEEHLHKWTLETWRKGKKRE